MIRIGGLVGWGKVAVLSNEGLACVWARRVGGVGGLGIMEGAYDMTIWGGRKMENGIWIRDFG